MQKTFIVTNLLLTFLTFAIPAAQAAGSNFGGVWMWRSKSANFEIHIVQNGQKIKAAHFASVDNGRRVDNQENPDETGPSIVGRANGNSAVVDITSSYSGESGKATMTLENNVLKWKVTKAPKGEFYFPTSANLNRKKEKLLVIADHPSPEVQAMGLSVRARELESAGHLEEALSFINRSIAADPNDWTSYETRADVLMKLKQYENALGALKKAMELCPENMRNFVKQSRGECYVKLNKADLAIPDLTEAIDYFKKQVRDNDSMKKYLSDSYLSRAEAYKTIAKNDLAAKDEAQAKLVSK